MCPVIPMHQADRTARTVLQCAGVPCENGAPIPILIIVAIPKMVQVLGQIGNGHQTSPSKFYHCFQVMSKKISLKPVVFNKNCVHFELVDTKRLLAS